MQYYEMAFCFLILYIQSLVIFDCPGFVNKLGPKSRYTNLQKTVLDQDNSIKNIKKVLLDDNTFGGGGELMIGGSNSNSSNQLNQLIIELKILEDLQTTSNSNFFDTIKNMVRRVMGTTLSGGSNNKLNVTDKAYNITKHINRMVSNSKLTTIKKNSDKSKLELLLEYLIKLQQKQNNN